jgi:hypothetical protein
MRKSFEMTQEQYDKILDACKPTLVMKIGNTYPATPQENANRAWAALGKEMGFKHMTVRPIDGDDQKTFSAEAAE